MIENDNHKHACAVEGCTQPGYWQTMVYGIMVSPAGDGWRQLSQQRGPYYCAYHGDIKALPLLSVGEYRAPK